MLAFSRQSQFECGSDGDLFLIKGDFAPLTTLGFLFGARITAAADNGPECEIEPFLLTKV